VRALRNRISPCDSLVTTLYSRASVADRAYCIGKRATITFQHKKDSKNLVKIPGIAYPRRTCRLMVIVPADTAGFQDALDGVSMNIRRRLLRSMQRSKS